MLSSLLSAPLTAAVDAALAAAPAGRVAVLGDAGLARRLADRGRPTVAVTLGADRARRPPTDGIAGQLTALPFGDGELAALIAARLVAHDGWEAALIEWRRAIKPGGLVILVDRGEPTEPARRALCGGLTDVAQRATGRTVVTSGRVVHLE